MKVLHTADLHGGLTRYGHPTPRGGNSRIDDFGETLTKFGDAAVREQVALAVFAGDTFHTRRMGPQELALFSAALQRLRGAGIAVVIVPGNHDGPSTVGDWRTNALLYLEALKMPGVTVFLRPNDEVIETRDGPVRVVGLPYPHKRAFDEVFASIADPDERAMEAGRRYEGIIRSFGEATEGIPNIAVGHLSVAGSKTSTEATMRIGWDLLVDASAFDAFDLAALGHIHRQQRLSDKVYYAGSPEYMDFSEEGNPKGFLLHEVVPGLPPVTSIIDVNPRPLFTLTFDGRHPVRLTDPTGGNFEGDHAVMAEPVPVVRWQGVENVKPGGIVRLIIHLDGSDPPRVAKVVSEARRATQPSFLKVDVRVAEQERAMRSDIDSDLDVVESLRRWLVAQGHPEEPALSAGRELVASVQKGADQ